MKTLFRAVLAAALLTGTAAVALTSPADAAKKKDDAKQPQDGLKLTPEVRNQAAAAQAATAAKNYAAADAAVAALDAAAKTDDDRYVSVALKYDLAQHKVYDNPPTTGRIDDSSIKAPLDALLASPNLPAANKPQLLYRRGLLAFNQRNFPEALSYFDKAKALGFTDPDLPLQTVRAKVDSGDTAGGIAELKSVVTTMTAAGKKAPEDYYQFAIAQTLKAKLNAQTLDWMRLYVQAYPGPKTWRVVLYNYGLQQGSVVTLDKLQTLDLFRLMRQTKSLADQAEYVEYAQTVLKMGLPEEAKAVITEGRANGALPPTAAAAELADANRAISTEGSLANTEKKAAASPTGALSQQTADAYLGQGNYAKATALYQQALSKGGVKNDEVYTHLGIAMALGGDKPGAKEAFAKVTTAPRSDIAGFWSLWADMA